MSKIIFSLFLDIMSNHETDSEESEDSYQSEDSDINFILGYIIAPWCRPWCLLGHGVQTWTFGFAMACAFSHSPYHLGTCINSLCAIFSGH